MLLQTHDASVTLADRQMLSFIDAQGVKLCATHGTLWVTQEGDPMDRILQAGDSLTIRHGGRTLVTAMSGAAALAATRREVRRGPSLWRNLRERIARAVLLGEPARLRPMMLE